MRPRKLKLALGGKVIVRDTPDGTLLLSLPQLVTLTAVDIRRLMGMLASSDCARQARTEATHG